MKLNVPTEFTAEHAALLRRFLASPRRPADTMTFPQLAGLVFAVACAPDLVMPSDWLPLAFNDQDPNYETRQETDRVLEAVMALYNSSNRLGAGVLPPGCEIRTPAPANLDADAPLSQWASGFATGYGYLHNVWDEALQGVPSPTFRSLIAVLGFFADPTLAAEVGKKTPSDVTPERIAETIVALLPDAVRWYAEVGSVLFRARVESGAPDVEPRSRRKVGRNDPCPCGAGKKFKKCCGMASSPPIVDLNDEPIILRSHRDP